MIELNLLRPAVLGGIWNLKSVTHPTLSQLIEGYPVLDHMGNLDIDISSIVYDSRQAQAGSLFIAIPGTQKDGIAYVPDAVNRGAAAVLTETSISRLGNLNASELAVVQVQNCRNAMPYISRRFFKDPSRKMNLIGVTGTNGKTTVTYLLESIFKCAGQPAGILGTIDYRYGNHKIPAKMTTPESPDINQMLAKMVDLEVRYCLMEVSSHALTYQRVNGLEFAVTVFTNLSRDHLDFHGTFENYILSKKSLFQNYPSAKRVVNIDDSVGGEIFREYPQETLTTAIHNSADIKAENLELNENGSRFDLKTPKGNETVQSTLLGKHNVYNMLSAIGAALQLGFPLDTAIQGIQSLHCVPGRFERIDLGQDFTVAVDYAHTDDALSNVLKAARAFIKNRIILVFGCGGDRDRGKRKEMGRVALHESDFAVITSDNPRTEDPEKIIQDICDGLPVHAREKDHYLCISNRKEAIEYAIQKAQNGDIVLIAGKGHEDYQILNTGTIHFDDRETAEEALKKRLNL